MYFHHISHRTWDIYNKLEISTINITKFTIFKNMERQYLIKRPNKSQKFL